MPYIQFDDQQFALGSDETLVGSGADAHIRLGEEGDGVIQAVIRCETDGTIVVRRASPEIPVRVNGVTLGAEPVPLMHGDKIDVNGKLLVFGNEPSVGSTQFLEGVRPGELARTPTAARSAAAAGGRLVSLVDGREYSVPAAGLVLGRDPSCDVVLASTQVSRRHAVISSTSDGYVITDTSTNGIQVNGEAVAVSRALTRGDIVRLGEEEFRFSAQSAPVAVPAPPAAPVVETPPPLPLATLEVVNEGVLKGRTFEIHAPLAHVGRGAHNDVMIPDSSVSEMHAKLQRRDTGWVIVDMDSTNGTYVGGRRIVGEQTLTGSRDVRFGNVKCNFRVPKADQSALEAHGTRIIAPVGVPERVDTAPATPRYIPRTKAPSSEPSAPTPEPRRTLPAILWVTVLLAVAAGAVFIMSSR